jgi:hypothetical protein
MNDYNDLLLEELRGMKADLLSIRQSMGIIKTEYIHKSTFWAVMGIYFTLITGAYLFVFILWVKG